MPDNAGPIKATVVILWETLFVRKYLRVQAIAESLNKDAEIVMEELHEIERREEIIEQEQRVIESQTGMDFKLKTEPLHLADKLRPQ